MRFVIALVLGLFPLALAAQGQGAREWEDLTVFNAEATGPILRIISSTDTALFAPVIRRFVSDNSTIGVEYMVTGTADIDRIFRDTPQNFDLVISSAMDLQLKAANDGLARAVMGTSHADWAHWRHSLFAFTSEPAAIVVNRQAFAGHEVPRTRQELIEAMRARPQVFQGRIGTYDVRQSGLGYLFATQDARASETYWRLMEVMGALDVRLYCCSGEMIDDLADGTIAVAYNVLASYAQARAETQNDLEIVLPLDFPTTMMRTALVSTQAPHPGPATAFLRHLLVVQNTAGAQRIPLPLLGSAQTDMDRATIALEPALMTFLDTLKRRRFLAEWEDAVIQQIAR